MQRQNKKLKAANTSRVDLRVTKNGSGFQDYNFISDLISDVPDAFSMAAPAWIDPATAQLILPTSRFGI